MTTLLHFLAWTGAIMIVAFVVLMLVLVPLGVLDRFRPEADADPDDEGPFLRSQFTPHVPPNQPHTPWSEVKDRRDRDTDAGPAS